MKTETVDRHIEPILQLSVQERIYIYQVIWQSILKDMEMENVILSDEQKTEIDRRLERLKKGEAKLYNWQEIKKEIKSAL